MMWTLFIAAIAIWVLQTALTLWQFRRFNRRLKELRQSGPVAIGKAKGRFLAGDALPVGYPGDIMEGVTVFAKCHPFSALNGLNLLDLSEALCEERELTRQQAKAALSARQDYLSYQELKREKQLTPARR